MTHSRTGRFLRELMGPPPDCRFAQPLGSLGESLDESEWFPGQSGESPMTDHRDRHHARWQRKRDKHRRRLERQLDHRLAKFDRKLARKIAEHHGAELEEREPSRPRPHPQQGRRRRGRRELTPEEQAYREARKRANARLSVWIHGVVYALVLFMLMVVTRGIRVPLIVGVCWGIGFGTHYFVAVMAPRLRRRWIQEEVTHQVERGVSAQREVVQGQHVRSLEELSASIAHEIRNPITAAKSLVQQMGEDPLSGENIEYAQVALDELDRVERSISHLLKYARDEELRLEPVRMRDVVASALDTFPDRTGPDRVELEWDSHSEGVVRGDADKLRRIVINLVGNAIDVLEEAGTTAPCVVVACGENLAGSEVWLRIRDNGPGIDEEGLGKIWNPFYTTKERGTGLGLALSKKIVDAHGGTLEVDSTPGEGTEFVMTLPKFTGESGARGGSPTEGGR